tara:strand:+ start:420 stop:671 length:252 start_codon:yes stop_codon:yes gene_type:complete
MSKPEHRIAIEVTKFECENVREKGEERPTSISRAWALYSVDEMKGEGFPETDEFYGVVEPGIRQSNSHKWVFPASKEYTEDKN